MKLILIGAGGREYAMVKRLAVDERVDRIICIPGNGAMSLFNNVKCIDNISATDIESIVMFAKEENPDLVIVSPDDPLVLGLVDRLTDEGILAFGPTGAAAEIEGSKAFAKELMKKYNIPTASYEIFTEMEHALSYLEKVSLPVVIKADGLALGKGVFICNTIDEAISAVHRLMKDKIFGNSGNSIVIEEFMTGIEASVFALSDGNTITPIATAMDHKKIFDGDLGDNTGGMGVIAPHPLIDDEMMHKIMNSICIPTIDAMKKEGREFKGCLYMGLMLTADGPKVIEFNCRFGDPEAQTIFNLIDTPVLDLMLSVSLGSLSKLNIKNKSISACTVVMASKGYPGKYETGFPINISDTEGKPIPDYIDFAGVKLNPDGKLVTSGGRVLAVTKTGNTLKEAIDNTYLALETVKFENAYFRKDIGHKVL